MSKTNQNESKTLKKEGILNKQDVVNAYDKYLEKINEDPNPMNLNDYMSDLLFELEDEDDLDVANEAEEELRKKYNISNDDLEIEDEDDYYLLEEAKGPREVTNKFLTHIIEVKGVEEDSEAYNIIRDLCNYLSEDEVEDFVQQYGYDLDEEDEEIYTPDATEIRDRIQVELSNDQRMELYNMYNVDEIEEWNDETQNLFWDWLDLLDSDELEGIEEDLNKMLNESKVTDKDVVIRSRSTLNKYYNDSNYNIYANINDLKDDNLELLQDFTEDEIFSFLKNNWDKAKVIAHKGNEPVITISSKKEVKTESMNKDFKVIDLYNSILDGTSEYNTDMFQINNIPDTVVVGYTITDEGKARFNSVLEQPIKEINYDEDDNVVYITIEGTSKDINEFVKAVIGNIPAKEFDKYFVWSDDVKEENKEVKTEGNYKVDSFSGIEFEKKIPYEMRFKEYSIVEDDTTLYWVTQEFFGKKNLEEFSKAFKDTEFEKACVTVRDLSTYNYNKDMAGKLLVVLDKEGNIYSKDYEEAIKPYNYDFENNKWDF